MTKIEAFKVATDAIGQLTDRDVGAVVQAISIIYEPSVKRFRSRIARKQRRRLRHPRKGKRRP